MEQATKNVTWQGTKRSNPTSLNDFYFHIKMSFPILVTWPILVKQNVSEQNSQKFIRSGRYING